MKKFFRLVSMLAVAGLTFTYTSCTDYSEDIDANKDSIDAVKTEVDGKLSSLSEQLSSVNKTIDELKTTDAAAAKSVEALEASSAALKEQLAALEKSFADNKTAVTTKYDAEVGKINAAIVELKEAYATADGNLKNELQSQIDVNKAKIDTLNARLEKQISALEEAYKNADAELKSQILANATAISGLQTDIKTINEETIPAAKAHAENLVNALKSDVAETYATKAALTDSTAKVTKLVNSAVVTLTARLESAEKRLTSLEAAQKAFEEDLKKTKESYDAQIETINAEIAANKTAISLLGSDAAAVRKVLDSLDTKLKAAAAAAAAAQKTADNAVAAAAAAQTTANNAVAAAAAAKTAADNAQKTADEALGKVESLIEALGVYAKKDSLKIKIELLFEKDFLLAQKANELAAKDLELSGDIADLDAKVDSLVKAANDRIDSVITAFNGKIADLAAADKKMGEQIAELFADKFDKTAFAGEFKAAYDARFGEDFRTAYEARFSKDFDAAFSKAWNAKYDAAFKDAFSEAWGTNFTASFDNALDTVWDDRFEESFDGAIAAYIATALAADGVIYAKIDELVGDATTALEAKIKEVRKNLEKQIEDNTVSFKAVNDKIDAEVKRIDEAIGEIRLIVNELVSNRIQSIVFVPEYDDMNATVHYYYVGAAKTPVSNEKIVEASFDVYPAKLANTITEDNASVVAVTVGSRAEAANEADKTIITPDATIKGRINVKAKFTTGVNCDLATGKAPFAISLRVMEDTKKPINGNEVEIGNYIESSFVGVKLANDCDLTNAYCIYDFINHKEITAAELATEKAWSVSEDDALFTPFKNYSIGLKFGTQYMTIEGAAEYLNVSEDKITPILSQKATYYNKSNASTPAFSKYYKLESSAKAEQLNYSITMTAEAKKVAELTNSVGSSCKNEITAKVNGVVISNISKAISYKIVNRKATITVDPYTVDWTYDNAVKLSTAPTTTDPDWKPYVKPIDKTFKEVLNELRAELTYNYDETKDDPALKLDLKKVLLEADGVTKRTPTDRAGYNVTNDNTRGAALTNAPVLDIDPLAFINGKLASVSITNYKTWFTGKTYELVNTYANPATYTDVEVSMKLTLGLCPESKEIQLGKTELVFKPGAATENALSKDPVTEAFATVPAGAFNDVAQFKESLTDWFEYNETPGIAADAPTWNANRPKVWRTDVNPKAPVSPEWTLLVPFDGTKSYIRLSQADVTSFKNTYEFETAFQTWYGPKYTFKATGSIKPVAYKLDYHRDLVTIDEDGNASVTLKGKKDASTGDIYKILTDDLSKYFGLTGEGFGAASTNLKVVYSVETVTDVAKGYDNIPTVSGTPKAVASDGGIDKEDIDWGTYTARDLKVKATLTYGGKEIDAKELTLNIEDPISFKTDVEGNVYAENRVPYQKVVVNLWKHLVVNSILSPEYNQLNQSVTALAASSVFPNAPDVWQSRAQAGYDLALEFELVDDSVKVGGEVTPLPSTKLVFDAEKGTLTYNDDSAHMVKDVEAMVKVTLKHKFNYDNKAPKLGEDYIYITVKIAEN